MNLRQQTLDAAGRNLGRLDSAIQRSKATDARRLQDEYSRLVSGLAAQGQLPVRGSDWLANPVLPSDILQEAVGSFSSSLPSLFRTSNGRVLSVLIAKLRQAQGWKDQNFVHFALSIMLFNIINIGLAIPKKHMFQQAGFYQMAKMGEEGTPSAI